MLAYVNASIIINTVSPTFTSGTKFNVNNTILTLGVWCDQFIMATISFESSVSNSEDFSIMIEAHYKYMHVNYKNDSN